MKILRFIRKGIAHEEKGIECQDTAEYLQYSADTAVMALSDGAGQAQYAKKASECNVKAILELFAQIPPEDFIKKTEDEQRQLILGQCMRFILQEAEKVSCDNLNHFSATLVFAVITRDFVLTGHLGDGAIYMTDEKNRRCFSSEPENIQVSHRTYFTISSEAYEHLYLRIVKREESKPAMLVLMSDGPQLMFKDRGFGVPEETAEEMAPFLLNGQVKTDEDLGSLLDAMTELESEKTDDWSLLAAVMEMEKKKTEEGEKEEEKQEGKEERKEENKEEKEDIKEKNVEYISEEFYQRYKNGNLALKLMEEFMKAGNRYDFLARDKNQAYRCSAVMMEKFPKRDRPSEIKRLRKVTATLKQLKGCSNIVELVDYVEIRSDRDKRALLFLLLEKGRDTQTLAEFCRKRIRKNRLKEPLFSNLPGSILQALAALEEHKIIHGNINFNNILVDVSGRSPRYLLRGFENASESSSQNQYKDIWNLGRVLYTLARFERDPKWIEILRKVRNRKYQNAKEMLKDVENT